jgi:hypothetical protein
MSNNIILKKHPIIMLPTKQAFAGDNILLQSNNILVFGNYNAAKADIKIGYSPQHLYVLSDDRIEYGDWYLGTDNNEILRRGPYPLHIPEICKKIIATTDPHLKDKAGNTDFDFPKDISKEFVKLFLKEYNYANIIKEVSVEYEEINKVKTCVGMKSSPSDLRLLVPSYEMIGKIVLKLNLGEIIINVSIETIVCAANWYKELPTPVYKPKGIEKGVVFCGHSHLMCLHQMIAMTGKRQAEVGYYEEGFITSKNRFVGREEAAEIALACNQINKLNYSRKKLYSEDLYQF